MVATVQARGVGPITKDEAEFIRAQQAERQAWGYTPEIFDRGGGQYWVTMFGDQDKERAEALLASKRMHCRILSGVDEHVGPPTALCGKNGNLAGAGDYNAVTCPECRKLLATLKITIQTDADFTPPGKRTARNVKLARGKRQLRWYVSGRIYRKLPVTGDNLGLTSQWLDAGRK